MRRRMTESIGEVLSEWIANSKLQAPLKEMEVRQAWSLVIPQNIQSHVRKMFFKEGYLRVYIDSTTLVNDLYMCRTRIAELLNKQLGNAVVKDIGFSICRK